MRILLTGRIPSLNYAVAMCLGEAGHQIILAGQEHHKHVYRSRYVQEFVEADTLLLEQGGEALTTWLAQTVRDKSIDIIVPGDILTMVGMADIKTDVMKFANVFPLANSKQIELFNNKWWLMQKCRSLGIDHPESYLLEDVSEISDIPLSESIIIKPLSEGFNLGVYQLNGTSEIADHLVDPNKTGNQLPLLVQEYIPGIDIDLTVMVNHGDVIADVVQIRTANGHGFEYSENERAVSMIRELASESGYHGIMDFDLRYDQATDRLVIIECNPRFPATINNKLWAGVNLPEIGIALAEGRVPTNQHNFNYQRYEPFRFSNLRLLLNGQLFSGAYRATRAGWRARLSDPIYSLSQLFSKRTKIKSLF